MDPFVDRSFRQMQRDMNRLLTDFFDTGVVTTGGTRGTQGLVPTGFGQSFAPRLDVYVPCLLVTCLPILSEVDTSD
jgi:hypothetical protein